MMRPVFLLSLLLSLFGLIGPVAAQIDTTAGKFYQPLYGVAVSSGVAYGAATNVQGSSQTLLMDVYEPINGPAGARPVLILAHGGGFIFGTRTDQDVSELCRRFARLGYVTASIDYRLNGFAAPDANTLVRAMHDMRAAVRYFRKDAATTNLYHAAPDYLFVGGSSAGAFTALNTAFLDKETELVLLGSTEAGGVEGQSGNAGYSSATRAAVNLCGALGQSVFIEAGSEPFVSMHGTLDTTVPYNVGTSPFNPSSVVYGSGALAIQATAVGVTNPLYPFRGAGHVPFSGTSAKAVAYMDTTFRFVRNFLRSQLGGTAPTPMPVSLTYFEANRQGANAVLTWETATESDNRGFEVQVSTDGQVFNSLGFVAASGPSSSTKREYQLVDDAPAKTGRRYYRLRQLDLNGKAAFYGPRVLDFGLAPAGRLSAYPNPFTDALTVEVPALTPGAYLQVHDAQGRLLLTQPLEASASLTRRPVVLPTGLAPGSYLLTLILRGGPTQHVQLLKQ